MDEVIKPRRRWSALIAASAVMIAVAIAAIFAFPIAALPVSAFTVAMIYRMAFLRSDAMQARYRADVEARAEAWLRGYDVIR